MVEKIKTIRSEEELSEWFMKNYNVLGYSKILKNNKGRFPDFVMLKNEERVLVELETLASHFILHKHDKKKVDEVVCIEKDISLGVPVIKVNNLKFSPNITRVSATLDPETIKKIGRIMKTGRYRNVSHLVEDAIKSLSKMEEKDGK